MASDQATRRFAIRSGIAAEPMPVHEWEAAEDLLARLVARAFAADNPQLFCLNTNDQKKTASGSLSAARAEAVAPAAKGGDPEGKWSVEHYGERDSDKASER